MVVYSMSSPFAETKLTEVLCVMDMPMSKGPGQQLAALAKLLYKVHKRETLLIP